MKSIFRFIAAILSLALCFTIAPVEAQTPSATVSGLVVDQRGGLPVAGATVVVSREGTTIATGTTSGDGRYRLTGVTPGVYDITVRAQGYNSSITTQVSLVTNVDTNVSTSLSLSPTSNSTGVATIGRTSSEARSQLAAASTISQSINTDNLTRTGQIRVADQLATLPALNFSSSSSVGDDASVNLRGFGPDETAVLLDGHPVGPLGVGSGGFNIALGPAFGLSSVIVTYGSGAQGLYGNDTIGGAINFVTLSPTAQPHATFQQQFGGFGIASTGITATGSAGRLGYALAYGRLGETGDFAPGQIAQSARPNNVNGNSVSPPGACNGSANVPDVSACNLANNTYAVSQNTNQQLNLGKLSYSIGNSTKVEATAYNALEFADSTGNGDNDYTPYSTRLNQVNSGAPNCTTAAGGAGYTVTTDPIGSPNGNACYTAAQFANATYGPDGGGAGRDRGTRMSDYHGRITTTAGVNTFTVDGYLNNYVYYKNSSQAGGVDASGNFLGAQTYADFYNTKGFLVSDEIAAGRNDVTFGYNVWHQLQTGNEADFTGFTVHPALFFGEWSGFLHDTYQLNNVVTGFLNANLKRSSVSQHTTFDPRATIQVRPTSHDVFQVTYGRSDGAPSPSLLQTALPAIAANPGASLTTVSCNGLNDVTSAGNPNLLSESANDYEAGYGHRFKDDSNVQLNAYVTHVTNQLFGASEPLSQYGVGNVAFANGALQAYINRINTQCGLNVTPATVVPYLSVGTTFNAASALARGLELSGRERINRLLYVDYSYDIESSAHVGISDAILAANPTVVNGAQLPGIPLHQASLSLGFQPGPWDFRLDTYYVEQNNTYNRPSYYHSNVFLTRAFNKGRTLITLGGTNIFNNAVQDFGYIGLGTTPIVNPISGATARANEEYGLAPAQITLTLQQRY